MHVRSPCAVAYAFVSLAAFGAAGGDNHADQPARPGGGGVRITCGVIP